MIKTKERKHELQDFRNFWQNVRGFDSTTTYQSIMEIGFDIVRVGRVVELVGEKLLTLPPPAHLRNSSNLDLSWLLRVIISSLIFGLHFFFTELSSFPEFLGESRRFL